MNDFPAHRMASTGQINGRWSGRTVSGNLPGAIDIRPHGCSVPETPQQSTMIFFDHVGYSLHGDAATDPLMFLCCQG